MCIYTHTSQCIHIYTCMYTRTYNVYIYIYASQSHIIKQIIMIYTYVYVYIYIYICICICIYISIYVYVYIYTYIYVYMHTYMYTYIHICVRWLLRIYRLVKTPYTYTLLWLHDSSLPRPRKRRHDSFHVYVVLTIGVATVSRID